MSDFEGKDRRNYLTVRDVADMWNVSDDKVRADIRKGALEHYLVKGCIRVRLRDAQAYGRRGDSSTSAA